MMTPLNYITLIDSVIEGKSWTALEAYRHVVRTFGLRGQVYYCNQYRDYYTFLNLMQCNQHRLAKDVTLHFWSGPPDKRKYRLGTLLDLLYDSCYYQLIDEGGMLRLYEFLKVAANSDDFKIKNSLTPTGVVCLTN